MIRTAWLRRLLVPIWLVAWMLVVAPPATVVAQEAAATATTGGRPWTSYIVPYVLVVVVVGLGLMVVARSSRRKLPRGERSPLKLGVMGHGAEEADESDRPGRRMKKPHRAGLVFGLAFTGILCPIMSFIVLSMANGDLEEIEAGRMDRAGEGKLRTARTIAIVFLILDALLVLGGLLIGLMGRQ